MEQILWANGLPRESATTIIILHKNTKGMVRSPSGNTNFFESITEILQGDTLVSYIFIIYLDYVLWMSIDLIKDNSFT